MDDYLKMDDYLNKFLWRAGYEFLQIEGLEIGYILEVLFGYCLLCQREHHAGKRRMPSIKCALGCVIFSLHLAAPSPKK